MVLPVGWLRSLLWLSMNSPFEFGHGLKCHATENILAIIYQVLALGQVLTGHWIYLILFNIENSLHFLRWRRRSLVRVRNLLRQHHSLAAGGAGIHPPFPKSWSYMEACEDAPACVTWRYLLSLPHNLVKHRVPLSSGCSTLQSLPNAPWLKTRPLCITRGKDNNIYHPLGI